MARIKGWSLSTIASLGKAITISTWKGIVYLKKHVPKLGPPKSELVIRNNTRFKIANIALWPVDHTVIWGFRWWAEGSHYAWKDQYISRYLRLWTQYNQAPINIIKIDAVLVVDVLEFCVTYGNYFILPGEGYGTIAYGASPYGHSPKFYPPYGFPLRRTTVVRYSPPPNPRYEPKLIRVRWPSDAPYLPASREVTCMRPRDLDGPIVPDVWHEPGQTFSLDLSYDNTSKRYRDADGFPTCAAAYDWGSFMWENAEIFTPLVPHNLRVEFWQNLWPGGFSTWLANSYTDRTWSWPGWLDDDAWRWISGGSLHVTYAGDSVMFPMVPLFTFGDQTILITDPDAHHELDIPTSKPLPKLFFSTLQIAPFSRCPEEHVSTFIVDDFDEIEFSYWYRWRYHCAHIPMPVWSEFVVWIDRAPENPGINCPPHRIPEYIPEL